MRIAIIAHHTAAIAPPFAGGVESHTYFLARWLAARGHRVTLFAMPGTDVPGVRCRELRFDGSASFSGARRDVASEPGPFMAAHHAYLRLMTALVRRCPYDVVHVNALHYLPVAMARAIAAPSLMTLHCPPTPWLESALDVATRADGDLPVELVAVSQALADAWSHVGATPAVVHNGVDTTVWTPGPGGPHAAWVGRMVPEKAPHLAIAAARKAGLPLRLAGPIFDHAYWRGQVEPHLGPDVTYLGHLDQEHLVEMLGGARVCIQSADWEEPFGLTAAEAMACGTPVAAFARGGLKEIVSPTCGALATPGDVDALARAVRIAAALPRHEVRAHAVRQLSIDRMGRAYEAAYRRVRARRLPVLSGAIWPAALPIEQIGLSPELA